MLFRLLPIDLHDNSEEIALLDTATLQKYQREVLQARTRPDLDSLTRAIWKAHDQPANADALTQLRKAIESWRDVLARNNPR